MLKIRISYSQQISFMQKHWWWWWWMCYHENNDDDDDDDNVDDDDDRNKKRSWNETGCVTGTPKLSGSLHYYIHCITAFKSLLRWWWWSWWGRLCWRQWQLQLIHFRPCVENYNKKLLRVINLPWPSLHV